MIKILWVKAKIISSLTKKQCNNLTAMPLTIPHKTENKKTPNERNLVWEQGTMQVVGHSPEPKLVMASALRTSRLRQRLLHNS